MADSDISVGQVLLNEYERVKDEQKARIGFRDNLLYATLGSMALTVTGAVTGPRAQVLLLLPVAAVVLGWTYLVNDEKISAIGRYVRDVLGPRLASVTGADDLFGWESAHRDDRRRRSRKWLQLGVDLLTFCGTSAAAILSFWIFGPVTVALVLVSVLELAAVGVLAWQIVAYADLRR
jgi:hypothetical protein